MRAKPRVIISGFADEGPADKRAETQLTMLAALGLSYYSLRFVDAGEGGGVKNAMQLNRKEIRKLKKLHAEFGIGVSSIGSPIGKVKLLDEEDGSQNAFVPFARYLKNDVARYQSGSRVRHQAHSGLLLLPSPRQVAGRLRVACQRATLADS